MSGGFFRGTSADQDTRFSNKQAKLMKSQKFAPELEHLVDMTKVQMDAIRPWIAKRVTELLGFEDEVLINFIYGLLEGNVVNGKEVQISLTGFMEKNTGKFMKELWERLLSAEKTASSVPQQDLDAKAEDLRRKKAEDDKLVKDIQKKKDKESNESVWGRQRNMDEGYDKKAFDSDVEPSSKHARTKMPSEKAVEDGDVNMRNGFRRKRRSRSTSADRSHSPPRSRSHSINKSLSNSRSYASDRRRSRSASRSAGHRQHSVSADREPLSPRKRSITPRSRHSPRSSLSPPPRWRSSFSRRSRSRSPRRSPSLGHRRLRSPYHHRSPSSFRRRRSPYPYRRRSPSPVRRRRSPTPPRRHRRRSPTPHLWHRRRSPTPPRRHRSPSRDCRRSPSLVRHRRPPSHVRRGRSPSLVRRRRSPSPARRRRSPSLPRRRRSSSFDRRRRSPSPYRRDKSPPPYKHNRSLSPYQRGRSQSPVRSSKSFSPSKSSSPMSPVRGPPVAVSALRRHRSPSASRSNSPVTSPSRRSSPSAQKRYQRSPSTTPRRDVRRVSPTYRCRNSISPAKGRSSASPSRSPQTSPDEHRSNRTLEHLSPGPRGPSSVRVRERSAGEDGSPHESPVRKRREPVSQDGSLSPKHKGQEPKDYKSSHKIGKDEANRSRELSGKGVYPRTPDQQRSASVQDSLVGEKGSLPHVSDDKGCAELNNPQKNNTQGSDEHNEAETASLLVGKVDQKNHSVDSESEESDRHKRKRKRKHKRSERKEASSDDSYDSEQDDRKEAKRKKKEERRLRKEEKRRHRQERRRRREERRAEKLKMKDQDDSDVSDGEHTVRGSHRSNDEEAESERKKLEFELRQKALQSLKAKKGISS